MSEMIFKIPADHEALTDLARVLVEHGVEVEGYKDPNEMLTIKQAADEANRNYKSYYAFLTKEAPEMLRRPFGPTSDPRISRRDNWALLSRNAKG